MLKLKEAEFVIQCSKTSQTRINFVRHFQNFTCGISKLVFKYNVGLETFLLQCLLESEFFGDLVYKFRKNNW